MIVYHYDTSSHKKSYSLSEKKVKSKHSLRVCLLLTYVKI